MTSSNESLKSSIPWFVYKVIEKIVHLIIPVMVSLNSIVLSLFE